ncbi:ABC transporter ATP-binding protein [Desulfuromonas versatilis]|uniref:ABC transporter ATP-binding protein n=1 Tax=Desulfuromonas versatilis TaxID=2802975 RepID=A0ABN6DX06_9BACT|nr:ABC transporter ATP-binding protein [Desulfuromonas versatilis]BCR04666.1 ABC transporter ATP-binding protein [Desulfuromonas versatilis]
MIALSFSNISKTYDPGLFKKKVSAVKDLSLDVQEGEVFGLVGPNGAGKSTTIRMLLGLIRPDSGTICFRGKPLAEAGIQKEIGYLPENPYLYDHLTLRELLVFCSQVSEIAPQVSRARIEYLLERTGMAAAQKRPLRTFSKGMLQRAGICFALLHDPSVVILDEPMSGLDPLGRKMVFDVVMELKEQGKTIFFCSHILSDVERLCDRIGVLVAGRLVREFSLQDFEQERARSIHLLLGQVSDPKEEALRSVPGEFLKTPSGCMLSIAPGQFAEVSQRLVALDIPVLATRSERVSLEELFLQTVKEHAA